MSSASIKFVLTLSALLTAIYFYISNSVYLDISIFFKPKEFITGIYNSTQLSIAYLYRDIITYHNPLHFWSFSPVPYFFPDAAIYFLLAPFLSINSAVLLSNAIYLIIYYILIVKIGSKLCGNKNKNLFILSAIITITLACGKLSQQEIFVPLWTSHFGSTILMYLLGMYLILTYRKRVIQSTLLIPIIIFTTLSDPYFFVIFCGSITFGLIRQKSEHKILIWILLAGIIGFILNIFDFFHLNINNYLHGNIQPFSMPFLLLKIATIKSSFTLFIKNNLVIFLLLIFFLILGINRFFKPSNNWQTDFIYISVAFSMLISVITSVLFDIDLLKQGFLSLRHFQTAIILPISLCLPLLLSHKEKISVWVNSYYECFLVIILIYLFCFKTLYPIPKILNIYPAITQCLDEYARKGKLISQNGVAQYWDAHVNAILSKENLNLVAIQRRLPYDWISTKHDYIGKKFNYVLIRKSIWSPKRIISQWGEPNEILTCNKDNNYTIFVYNKGFSLD